MTSWFESAREGATVIVPSERMARELRIEYSRRRSAEQHIWAAPHIIAFRQWTLARWADCLADLQLLHPAQELALHRYVLEADGLGERVVAPMSLARQMREADRIADNHRLVLDAADIGSSDEYAVFMRLREQLQERMTQRGWITAERVVDDLIARADAGEWTPDEDIGFYGFVALTGQQRYLAEALQARGSIVDIHRLAAPEPSQTSLRVSPDTDGEVQALANDLAELLDGVGDEQPRIAVFVPDIQKCRGRLDRILSARLTPGDRLPGDDDSPRPWAYSRGLAMSDTAAIGAAMDLLKLGQRDNEASRLSRVVLSASFWGQASAVDRAQVEYALRSLGGSRHKVGILHRLAERAPVSDMTRSLIEALCRSVDETPTNALPSAWCQLFDARLAAARWSLFREASSADYQLLNAWREIQRQMAAMDDQLGQINQGRAWAWLNELLVARDFNPRSQAIEPIRVLEYEDAPGMRFDHAFVLGLTGDTLPRPVRQSPFFEPDLLAQAGVPDATPERCLESGRRLAEWLAGSAASITLSTHAFGERGQMQMPSPMFGPWPAPSPVDEPVRVSLALETPDSDPVPAVSDEEAEGVRGGVSILAWQAQVPYVAFMRSRIGVKPMPETGAALSPRVQGTFIHRVLERLWGEIVDSDTLRSMSAESRRELIAAETYAAAEEDRLLPAAIYGRALAGLERRRVADLCDRWMRAEAKRVCPFEVVARERQVETRIAGLPLKLKIDRVDRVQDGGQDRIVLLDYKTGGYVSTAGWKPERLSDPQLPLYASSDATDALDVGGCDGIGLAHVAAHGNGFKLCSSFADDFIADRKGEIGHGIADWQEQLDGWREALQANAEAFMAGEAGVTHEMLRNPRGYEDIARLMAQREDA